MSETEQDADPRIGLLFDAMMSEVDLAAEAERDARAAMSQHRLDDAARSLADGAVHQRVAQILNRVLHAKP